jgi:hypothetical protein
MAFKGPNINFSLTPATPSPMTAQNLKTQLNALGYACPLTELSSLERYIRDGMAQVKDGASYLIAILTTKESVEARANALSRIANSAVHGPEDIAFTANPLSIHSGDGTVKQYYFERVNGSYTIPDFHNLLSAEAGSLSVDWTPTRMNIEKLNTVVQPALFKKLTDDKYNSFPYHSDYFHSEKTIKNTDANTIKELLVTLVLETSGKAMNDLKKSDVKPLLINRLGDIETSGNTFWIPGDMITIWANKPDGTTVEALGVINYQWYVSGKNASGDKKNDAVHKTDVKVDTWSAVYSDQDFIDKDFEYVKDIK